jgi:hypothetical protein
MMLVAEGVLASNLEPSVVEFAVFELATFLKLLRQQQRTAAFVVGHSLSKRLAFARSLSCDAASVNVSLAREYVALAIGCKYDRVLY